MLRNGEGEWISEPADFCRLVLDFDQQLYASPVEVRQPLNLGCPRIGPEFLEPLDAVISMQEEALFQMKPWKAPGVDGYQAGFSQQFWNTTKTSLWFMTPSRMFLRWWFLSQRLVRRNMFNNFGLLACVV